MIVFQTAAFIGALGQLLYKKGTAGQGSGRFGATLYVILGMLLYIGVTLLFMTAYRLGGKVSVLYPTYGVTFVWGLVFARLLSNERLTSTKLFGTLFVLVGVFLVAAR